MTPQAVRTAPRAEGDREAIERTHHDVRDPHRRSSGLVDVVLGGQDGLVNVLGVLLGVVSATGSSRVVLAAGLAAAVAESISMAAVAYTAAATRGEIYEAERAREWRHLSAVPRIEQDEIRAIYERKGFSGELLDRIVTTLTENRDVWISEMMSEEHHLEPVNRAAALRSSLVVGGSSLVGSLIPLAPFLVAPMPAATWASLALAAVVLFAFGAYKARVTVGSPLRGGLVLSAIGMASALAGYAVGALFSVPSFS